MRILATRGSHSGEHCLEFISNYDCIINYHPVKANKVADALSRKSVDESKEEKR